MSVSLSVLLLGLVATVYGASPGARVVGGTDAPEGKYPYMVSISMFEYHMCGGTILNERYVLTAGHCVVDKKPADLRVKYGITARNDTRGVLQQVEKLILHEQFVDFHNNDVALIKLKKKIVYNDKVQPVTLPTSDNIDETFTAVTIGWGRLGLDDSETPNNLQQIALNVIPYKECSERMTATRRHICTYTKPEEGICFGDSGGPLVAGNHQIGITSFVRPCAIGYPDVYVRVYSHLDWIEEHSRL